MNQIESDVGQIWDISYRGDATFLRHSSIIINRIDIFNLKDGDQNITAELTDGTVIPIIFSKGGNVVLHNVPNYHKTDISI